jgi:chondroitin AC lyase
MASEIRIRSGVGLNADLSFHHRTDNVISTLSYGTGYASAFAYWAAKTVGTKYALPQDQLKLLIDYYLDGICASMAFGKYADPGARNRDISRQQNSNASSAEVPEYLATASTYRAKELKEIIRIRKGEKGIVPSKDHYFWESHYFTQQRPDYFASVRMHSSRSNNMEQPHNEEGLKNHHYGDGSTWITVTGNEYLNIFPAFDFQKIPGTTIVQQPALPHWNELAKKGLTDFVGGVTDGRYGAAATDFASVHDPLKARKSYFFFDKEFVCVGAGIQSKADYPVVTTVNQCLLNGDVIIQSSAGQNKPVRGKHALNDVSWVWHDQVAYVFPQPVDINCNNTSAAGSWRSISHQAWATDDLVKKDIFCLWFDHGPRPVKAGYAYIVAPAMDSDKVDAYSKKTSIEILSNTPALQAVRNKYLQITGIVFYEAGEMQLADDMIISVSNPCLVMIAMNGKSIKKITVADPTQKLSSLQLTVKRGKKIKEIKVDLPSEAYAGQSKIIIP